MPHAVTMQAPPILAGFTFERVLSEDPRTRSASLLGHFERPSGEREAGVLLLEKTHFSPTFYEHVGGVNEERSLQHCSSLGANDVYHWILGWMPAKPFIRGLGEDQDAHVKLTLIRPATEAHIAKYSEQQKVMVVETPQLYQTIVKPWISAQPPERIQWVYNILDKKKEADTIIYEQTGHEGFIVSMRLRPTDTHAHARMSAHALIRSSQTSSGIGKRSRRCTLSPLSTTVRFGRCAT